MSKHVSYKRSNKDLERAIKSITSYSEKSGRSFIIAFDDPTGVCELIQIEKVVKYSKFTKKRNDLRIHY